VQRDEHADQETGGEQPHDGRQAGEDSHDENTSPFRTLIATGGSGDGAGPATTAPVDASKTLP
jgi:hypothetical protein